MRYEGDDTYTVLKSENAKLQADGPTFTYVAGKNIGLNRLEKL